ncbi:hypothetical protein [Streptomyces calidiresistens]
MNLGPVGSELVATRVEPPAPEPTPAPVAAGPRGETPGVPPRPFPPAEPPPPPPPAPRGACTQCFIGVAWDDEGRCRPCSEAGVRLSVAPPRTAPAIEAAALPGPEEAAPRRRLSFLSRRP